MSARKKKEGPRPSSRRTGGFWRDRPVLVTGATGLLGSHIVEQLVARGERVRALVRRSSEVGFLRQLGVELATVDLQAPETLTAGTSGCTQPTFKSSPAMCRSMTSGATPSLGDS